MSDIERDSGLARSPLSAQSLQIALVDGVVVALAEQPQPETLERPGNERVIKQAARLIDEHCTEPLGTADIAESVGLSVRALQAGFKTHFDTTPMGYVRYARLLRVRQALSDGTAQSVTEAAFDCGISHLGRLSADYRAAFGETPSETLQRAR